MTDIHDIKPLMAVLFPGFGAGAWYLLAGLLLMGLLAVAYWYWRKKGGVRQVDPAEIIVPPDVAALSALESLGVERGVTDKAFYFRLSAVLRSYLSGRFGVDGLEMTTEELLPAIDRLGIDRDLKSGIRDFLLFSDPVKFADLPVSGDRRDGDLDFITGFVKRTTSELTANETAGATAPQLPAPTGKNTA